jgi:DNA-binding CsgD family transcriptional regulator
MSDSTHREIIKLLKEGPKTAGEIADHFSHAQPTISDIILMISLKK